MPPSPTRVSAAGSISLSSGTPAITPPRGLVPDLTLLLEFDDVSVGIARARRRQQVDGTAGVEDRFEHETIAFHPGCATAIGRSRRPNRVGIRRLPAGHPGRRAAPAGARRDGPRCPGRGRRPAADAMVFAGLVGHQRAGAALPRPGAAPPCTPRTSSPDPRGSASALPPPSSSALCSATSPGPGHAPCGLCQSCRLAAGQAHPDSLTVTPDEKKKTKSISIDQVRSLGEWLSQSPTFGRRKAAILDPARFSRRPGCQRPAQDARGAAAGQGHRADRAAPRGAAPDRALALPAGRRSARSRTRRSPRCSARNGWPAQAARQAAGAGRGERGRRPRARRAELGQETPTPCAPCSTPSRRARTGRPWRSPRAPASARAGAGVAAGDHRLLRAAARQRLGDRGVEPAAVPAAAAGRTGTGGDRPAARGRTRDPSTARGGPPPNAKLALAGCWRVPPTPGPAMILTTAAARAGREAARGTRS